MLLFPFMLNCRLCALAYEQIRMLKFILFYEIRTFHKKRKQVCTQPVSISELYLPSELKSDITARTQINRMIIRHTATATHHILICFFIVKWGHLVTPFSIHIIPTYLI